MRRDLHRRPEPGPPLRAGLDAGRVGINLPTSVGDLRVPGGGRKNSGRGEYEGAGDGIAFFTHLKPIFFAT